MSLIFDIPNLSLEKLPYSKTTLSNGLKILTIPMPQSPSSCAMVMVKVGSRYESDPEAGIAHFIEHNVFKGTKKRPNALKLDSEIESMGGIHNAVTDEELTFYWTKVPNSHLIEALDVVLDISSNAVFPPKELEIERGNVIEEIHMYEDNPQSEVALGFVYSVFDQKPLGRNIAGFESSVGSLKREDLVNFVSRFYLPQNMTIVVSGEFGKDAIFDKVNEYFYKTTPDKNMGYEVFIEGQTQPRVFVKDRQIQQTHLVLGVTTFNRFDQRRFALDVASAILGDGLGSRLFQKIRNELGLAYYVDSETQLFDDIGLWVVSAGVNNSQVEKAVEAIIEEFKRLKNELVNPEELTRAKEFLKGKNMFGVETSHGLASFYGMQELLEKEILTPGEINEKIEAVTAEDIQRVSLDLLKDNHLNIALVGPELKKESFETLLRF